MLWGARRGVQEENAGEARRTHLWKPRRRRSSRGRRASVLSVPIEHLHHRVHPRWHLGLRPFGFAVALDGPVHRCWISPHSCHQLVPAEALTFCLQELCVAVTGFGDPLHDQELNDILQAGPKPFASNREVESGKRPARIALRIIQRPEELGRRVDLQVGVWIPISFVSLHPSTARPSVPGASTPEPLSRQCPLVEQVPEAGTRRCPPAW